MTSVSWPKNPDAWNVHLILTEAVEAGLHSKNMNREKSFSLIRSRIPLNSTFLYTSLLSASCALTFVPLILPSLLCKEH
jgi:hypothetical protein